MKSKFTGFKVIVSIFAACCLIGCGTGTPPATVEHTPTGLPSASPSETQVPVELTTPVNDSNILAPQGCITISSDEVSWNSISAGTILMERGSSFPWSYFLYDLQSGKEYQLPDQTKDGLYDIEISPDKTKLAYTQATEFDGMLYDKVFLHVVNTHAEILSKFTFSRTNTGAFDWAGNDKLLLENYLTNQEGTFLLVDPFTLEQNLLRNEMPELYTGDDLLGLVWRVKYSSNLEWGMYVEGRSEFFSGRAILRDFVTNETLWESADDAGSMLYPRFSPDGNWVAYSDGYALKVMDQNIDVLDGTRVTYSDGYALKVIDRNGNALVIGELDDYSHTNVWSPDSRYLAFFGPNSMMLYDTFSNETVDLCIPLNTDYYRSGLMWSPDSKQIYVDGGLDVGEIVIDIAERTAYRVMVPVDDLPVGWMDSLP